MLTLKTKSFLNTNIMEYLRNQSKAVNLHDFKPKNTNVSFKYLKGLESTNHAAFVDRGRIENKQFVLEKERRKVRAESVQARTTPVSSHYADIFQSKDGKQLVGTPQR